MNWQKWVGVVACVILMGSCFLNWTFNPAVPDMNSQTFTGFFNYKQTYGRPGVLLCILGSLSLLLHLLPMRFAKYANLAISALLVAYAFRTWLLYNRVVMAESPEALAGIYIMVVAAVLNIIAAVFVRDGKKNIPA